MIYKTLHRKLQTEQHEIYSKLEVRTKQKIPAPLVTPVQHIIYRE